MKDVDRLLRDALKAEGDAYEPSNPDAAEREFMQKRGRRRLVRTGGAGLLAAAAAVTVFALVQPEVVNDRDERGIQPASLRVVDRYPVAEEPLAIAGAPSGIWIASREGGAVSRIDPKTGATDQVALEGANEIAVGDAYAWVGGAEGRTVRIDVQTLEITGDLASDAGAPVVDMAVGGHEQGAAWMVDGSGCLVDLTNPRPNGDCLNPADFNASDVATASNETWLLDGATGELGQFYVGPGVNDGRSVVDGAAHLASAPAGQYSDLLITTGGNDALWVSGEAGELMRLDLVTGEKTVTRLAGDYADLAAGYYSVWALVGHEGSDRGELVEIDVATGEPTGAPYSLSGKPSDVYAGVDGVWVTLRESNEVVRILKPGVEPVPVETTEATPSPEADGEELAQPLGRDDLVMVFSGSGNDEGETYAMFGDGSTEVITSPARTDLHPSFVQALYSNGPAIVVERRNLETLDSDLLYVDVPTGEETELVQGSLPAMSPDGQLAYWRMEKENATLFITEIGTDFSRDIPADHGLPRAIEWDAGGRFVYVESSAGHEDVRIVSYDSTGELAPIELDPGSNARYLAPSSRGFDSVHLIRIESDEDESDGPIDYIKLVEIPAASSDPAPHRELIALGELGIDENAFLPENLRLEATGTLDAVELLNGTVRWGIGEERSWILGFRTEAWLIKESGEIVELGEMFNGGLAINPELIER